MSSGVSNATGAERYAVFPLNVVLFPGGLLSLRIFEPRYQRMVSECLRNDWPFTVVAIVEGAEAGEVARTAHTGTLTRIIDWEQLDDGLLGLLCEGEQSVSIGEPEVERDRLLRADVRRLPLEKPSPLPAGYAWMAALLDEILERAGEPFDRLARRPATAAHVAHRLIELLPLPILLKQSLFELPDGLTRLQRLSGLIEVESGPDDQSR